MLSVVFIPRNSVLWYRFFFFNSWEIIVFLSRTIDMSIKNQKLFRFFFESPSFRNACLMQEVVMCT